MRTDRLRGSSDAGFSLLELLVSMAVLLVMMGAALTALTDAYRANEAARGVTGLNNNLRIGVDLIVRDLIQVGQGLPTGRVVQVPAGDDVLPFNRPVPQGSACTTWPAGITEISAVTEGPACGPVINGAATDVLTTIAGDTALDHVPLATGASGIDVDARTITIATRGSDPTGVLPLVDPRGVDISEGDDGKTNDIAVGDLVMLTKGTFSTLLYVTAVDGGQTITVEGGDPMGFNQFDPTLTWSGTLDQLDAATPTGGSGTELTRVRMVTYYLDTVLPNGPRLMRHMNWGDGDPDLPASQRARTVAFGLEDLQFFFDLTDDDTNIPDLAAAGLSPNQVRKVNLYLAARSAQRFRGTQEFFRNSLNTQVSLRSLALRDRYR